MVICGAPCQQGAPVVLHEDSRFAHAPVDSALPPPPPPPPTDEELFTPSVEARETMIKILARVRKTRGIDALLRAPLLAPIPDHFPDRWSGDVLSVRRVVRRLAHYAGLNLERVRVLPWRADADGNLPAGGPAVAAEGNVWFRGADADGNLNFGVDVQQVDNPEATAAASARAVAHAWLAASDPPLRVESSRLQLTIDVATVALGFGVLTTQAAIAHHVGASSGMSSQRKTTRLGVAGPVSMAFLLALHCTLRNVGPRAQRQIAALLRPNPAKFFHASITALAPDREALSSRLGLPPADHRPSQFPLSDFTGPLPEPAPLEEDAAVQPEDDEVRGMNKGKAVFRIERSMATSLGRFFGLGTMVIGGFASRAVADAGISMGHVTVTGLGLAVVGLIVGRFIPDHRCSEAKCGNRLPTDASECPRCGGAVAGSIKKATDRLSAQESLESADEDPAPPG